MVSQKSYDIGRGDGKGDSFARLLAVHASMGSKILRRERALTVDHLRKLAARFRVSPQLLVD
jgi:HTH-type transcriptional regulator / antitoxin HigA